MQIINSYFKCKYYVLFWLRYVQRRDAGLYECQVSTEPKLSHIFRLNVVGKLILIRFEQWLKNYDIMQYYSR